MSEQNETKEGQRITRAARAVDATDRRILGELTADADLSYAELGRRVALSPPAVHERVKRMRADGVIRATVVLADPTSVGKPMLAFVHVDTVGWGKSQALMALAGLPELEEIHSVTGDTCMLLKVRVASSQALEGLLARLYETPGVRSTRTYVALSTYLERPPQAGVSSGLDVDIALGDG
ncbi:MAG: Lrp/AsnC family transcriptional regulator [Pseudomonadota bacterium]